MLDIKENPVHAGLLVAAATIRLSFTNFLGLFLPSVVIERLFASRYIVDYEKVSRSWISATILVFTITLSIFFSTTIVLGFYHINTIILVTFIIHIVYVILYIYLLHRDFSKLRAINRGVYRRRIAYTLSIKYQLTENLRVLKRESQPLSHEAS
ncbi:hypothetical protein Angca_007117 [Angiostrongylus cantonensis]|nr:hypothetical protein Angca_007117 [Angiostrongylus cantonensis]